MFVLWRAWLEAIVYKMRRFLLIAPSYISLTDLS